MFAIWAPPESLWSRWAKPVLFTQTSQGKPTVQSTAGFYPNTTPAAPEPPIQSSIPQVPQYKWNPSLESNTAIIVNLPGEESVTTGLALAKIGYRPVPLYNSTNGPSAVVPLDGIITSLRAGTDTLQSLSIDPNAPPAFLLDSNRIQGLLPPRPGSFDNRWVVFPQDFPSATFLRSRQIDRVLLVQRGNLRPSDDLASVLGLWQQGKIQLLAQDPTTSDLPSPVAVRPRSPIRMWSRALLLLAIQGRRNNAGGFGTIIPIPGSSSG